MNTIELWPYGQRTLADATGRVYGVVTGVVTANKDEDKPERVGRVKVRLPWLADDAETGWIRIATPMAGKDRGLFVLPEPGDEVLVAFEHGDPGHPYVLGALWNGKDTPPATNSDGTNDKRMIRSRSGLTVLLDDTDGKERIQIADKDGKQAIVVDMAGKKVTITSSGDIELTAKDGTVTISAKTLKLASSGETGISAKGTLAIGGKTVNVKGDPKVNIN
ncbi:phage baseplate assembly protein V [Streptomyces sp. UC4497]